MFGQLSHFSPLTGFTVRHLWSYHHHNPSPTCSFGPLAGIPSFSTLNRATDLNCDPDYSTASATVSSTRVASPSLFRGSTIRRRAVTLRSSMVTSTSFGTQIMSSWSFFRKPMPMGDSFDGLVDRRNADGLDSDLSLLADDPSDGPGDGAGLRMGADTNQLHETPPCNESVVMGGRCKAQGGDYVPPHVYCAQTMLPQWAMCTQTDPRGTCMVRR